MPRNESNRAHPAAGTSRTPAPPFPKEVVMDDVTGWCGSCRMQSGSEEDIPDGSASRRISYNDCRNPAAKDEDQDDGERGMCRHWQAQKGEGE